MEPCSRKVLFVTPNWPLGATFGGQLRALHTARALRAIGDVTVVVVGSNARDADSHRATESEFRVEEPVFENRALLRGPADRLRLLIDPKFLNVHGVSSSAADRERIQRLQREHDLTWVFNARTPNILHIWHWSRTHLDIDDIPSLSFRTAPDRSMMDVVRNASRAVILRRRERALPSRFTTLSVCSDADRRYLGLSTAHVIPNGFEPPSQTRPRNPATPPRLGFIGLFSHRPNAEGIQWFLHKIWPKVLLAVPDARLRLIGRDAQDAIPPGHRNVDILGWVADPADEMATWSAMIVPLRFGSGTRIKIAEAFSRRCPVVSTPFGAYGYDVEDGCQLRLAAQPDAFAQACVDLMARPAAGTALAERAWADFLARWSWDVIRPRIIAAAEDCLRQHASHKA